jgi:hypothetical protein
MRTFSTPYERPSNKQAPEHRQPRREGRIACPLERLHKDQASPIAGSLGQATSFCSSHRFCSAHPHLTPEPSMPINATNTSATPLIPSTQVDGAQHAQTSPTGAQTHADLSPGAQPSVDPSQYAPPQDVPTAPQATVHRKELAPADSAADDAPSIAASNASSSQQLTAPQSTAANITRSQDQASVASSVPSATFAAPPAPPATSGAPAAAQGFSQKIAETAQAIKEKAQMAGYHVQALAYSVSANAGVLADSARMAGAKAMDIASENAQALANSVRVNAGVLADATSDATLTVATKAKEIAPETVVQAQVHTALDTNFAAAVSIAGAAGQHDSAVNAASDTVSIMGTNAAGMFRDMVNLASKSLTFHKTRQAVQQTAAGAANYDRDLAALNSGNGNTAQPQSADAIAWLKHQDAKENKNWTKFLADDVGDAGNGLLKGSVATTASVAKLGVDFASHVTKAVLPGIGIFTGIVGLAQAARSVYTEYQASKARDAQNIQLLGAVQNAAKRDVPQNLQTAVANVALHAANSRLQASQTSRWALAGHILKGLASATAIASNALTTTVVGAPVGVALACVSGAIAAGSLVCAARQLSVSRARAAETKSLQEAARNGPSNPAGNRICAVVALAHELTQPGTGRTTTMRFLTDAGMSAEKVEALRWACEGQTMTADHPAVDQLQRFFGL